MLEVSFGAFRTQMSSSVAAQVTILAGNPENDPISTIASVFITVGRRSSPLPFARLSSVFLHRLTIRLDFFSLTALTQEV